MNTTRPPQRVLSLDTETYSELPLKKVGAYRYSEACETIIVTYAWDDEPVVAWDLTDGTRTVADVQQLIDAADRVVIHNSPFERRTLASQGVAIPVEKIDDTMVMALAHGLPGSLEQLCHALHVPADKEKDKAGKKLIHLFTKPRPKNVKLRRATRETHPDEWRAFIEYAKRDVDAMRDVYRRIPRWNCTQRERDYWLLDQAINDRGGCIDLDLAEAALRAFERASRSLAAAASALTDGAVTSATQRAKLLEHLSGAYGFTADDLRKDTVVRLLDGDMPDEVRELLEIRQQASATSPSKYRTLLESTGTDGRLRGTIQFCGAARTGRAAGRLFQPQNLPRPTLPNALVEAGILAMKHDCEDLIYANVVELCTNAVRGCLVAAPGHKLVIADLSNIEGRVLAWLAGEQWKLDAFRAYDAGVGHDLYKITAGRILGKDPSGITKEERQQFGKTSELSCGYGGAVGAFRKMGGKAVDALSDDDILAIIRPWRLAHPRTKQFWYDCENAARAAIRNSGETYVVGLLAFDCKSDAFGVKWLRIKLPSGRYLCYMEPEAGTTRCGACGGQGVIADDAGVYATCEDCGGAGEWGTDQITYMGVDQYTRQWKRLETYYGRIVENVTQAVARDVFFEGLRRAEAAGYPVVLQVHDELVCETPDLPAFDAEELSQLMAINPGWSAGLPLAAAGFETKRYAKE